MKNLLKYPTVYNLFVRTIRSSKKVLANDYIKSDENKIVLDLCCGTCNILSVLEYKEYIGVDISDIYIKYAKEKFAGYRNVSFYVEDINVFLENNIAQFDIILLLGAMHHLNDEELVSCLQNIRCALNSGGRLITIDGCLEPNLSPIAKMILRNDRGLYVRTKDEWIRIFSSIFPDFKYSIRKDLLKIPYNHIIFY